MEDRPSPWTKILLPAGLFLFGAWVSFLPLWDIDWPLHVAMGRTILEGGGLPWRDTLSWTAQGRPDVLHEWLFQILWALLDRAGGPALLKGAVSFFAGAGLALWFRAARKAGRPREEALFFALAALLLFYPRLRARPDLVTWTALPLVLPFLLPGKNGSSLGRAGLLLLGTALWADFHGAALLAPLWFWAAWAAGLLEGGRKAPPLLPLAATAGVCLTPAGVGLWTYAWRTRGFGPLVPEWTSLSHLPPTQLFLFLQLGLALLALNLLLVPVWRKVQGKEAFQGEASLWGAGAAGTVLAVTAYRFAAASLPGLLFLLPRKGGARSRTAFLGASLAAALLLLALWAGRFSPSLLRQDRYPCSAAEFLAQRSLPPGTRLFHMPGWGGYLAYRLHPPCLVAVDGRVTTYGAPLCRKILALCRGDLPPQAVRAWLDQGRVDLVVMPEAWGARFLDPLQWRRIFQGSPACVWARRR